MDARDNHFYMVVIDCTVICFVDLFSVCEAKLVFCISEENAVSLLTYADVLQAQLLYGKCVQFITGHPSLQMSEEFKHLSLKTRIFIEGEYTRSLYVTFYNLMHAGHHCIIASTFVITLEQMVMEGSLHNT